MPFTPYHFGPAGLVGMSFRRWLDWPAFIAANVAVDVEVLVVNFAGWGMPVHRYAHTLMFSTLVGIGLAAVMYPFLPIVRKVLNGIGLRYESGFKKLLVGGILGAWFHVLVDAFCWYDVRLLWPMRGNPLLRYTDVERVRAVCVGFWVLWIIFFAVMLIRDRLLKNRGAGSCSKAA
jgi:hypothetical protein